MLGTTFPAGERVSGFERDRTPYDEYMNGYVYLLKAGPLVKVGQTVDPTARLKQHMDAMATFNGAPDEVWVSPAHSGYKDNESKLIAFAKKIGTPGNRGKESFIADYSAITDYAQTLEFKELSREEQKTLAKKSWGPIARQMAQLSPASPGPGRRQTRSSQISQMAQFFISEWDAEEAALCMASLKMIDDYYEAVTEHLKRNYESIRSHVDPLPGIDIEREEAA